MKPDLSTLRRCGVAGRHCAGDVRRDGSPRSHMTLPHSPRAMLKKQVARLAEMGFEAVSATELEFFIFEQSFEELRKDQAIAI